MTEVEGASAHAIIDLIGLPTRCSNILKNRKQERKPDSRSSHRIPAPQPSPKHASNVKQESVPVSRSYARKTVKRPTDESSVKAPQEPQKSKRKSAKSYRQVWRVRADPFRVCRK